MNFSQGCSRSSQRHLCISYSSLWIHKTRWKRSIGTDWRTKRNCFWLGVYEQYYCQLINKTRYKRSLLWPQVSYPSYKRVKSVVDSHRSKWAVFENERSGNQNVDGLERQNVGSFEQLGSFEPVILMDNYPIWFMTVIFDTKDRPIWPKTVQYSTDSHLSGPCTLILS